MAAEGEIQKEVAVHKDGYVRFIGMMKWGGLLSLLVALLVVFIIAD